ncbi:hypothetical protein AMATHDRAFT_147056 [Amanita thiersii Skay4041]|uniref:FAD-binding PCMH-type domain-containing protein n=1 Tax=Amanita thiersii Skay4041 TaxID=703135 RepID=A0A2A9NGH3_9AGAR|nr:hypothetical protein AMATHDRAFT_147056 [Amanita thiersii Skay4041]
MLFPSLTSSLLIGASAHLVSGAVVQRDAAAQAACQNLKSKLGTTIVQTVGSPEWTAALDAPWNLANKDVAPACVVFPYDHTHVAAAMKEIFENDAHYAVQAGGHTAMKNWNVVQDGVLIMFTHMNNATYSSETDTITLQPGLTWEEATTAVEPFGVAPLGARVRDVGTGALLGGGISYLSSEYGFASDMYKELDVVLPNGDFVTVNADNQYSDLFWALKGCANRCGIFPASANPDVITAIANFNSVEDPKAVLLTLFIQTTNPDGSTEAVTDVYIFYHGSGFPDAIFGELLSIPSTSQSFSALSYYDMLVTFPMFPAGCVQFFGGGADFRDATALQTIYNHWWNFTTTVQNEILRSFMSYTPLTKTTTDAGNARGGNPMDPPADGFISINFGVMLPAGITTVPDSLESARQLLFSQCPAPAGLPLYIGEIDVKQNAFATYGQYEKLKSVYAKYDPTRFNVNHLDGPIGL